MTEPEHHEHKSPLRRTDTAEEAESSFVDDSWKWQEQEYIDGNEYDEHAIPFDIDPVELHRD